MTMPARVVIDPNVYVSATITPDGTCGLLVNALDDAAVVAVTCSHLLSELERVLLRPKLRRYVLAEEVVGYVDTIGARAEHYPDPVNIKGHARDAKDDCLVALAIDADVDGIISGDPDLLEADVPVQIWSPREALDVLPASPG